MSKRILIVEDDHDTVDLIKCVLESRGYSTRSATTAGEAVPALEQFQPHVILLDLSACDIAIADVAARTAGIRIVLLSASGQIQDIARTLHLRFFLSKPFDPDALFEMVKSAIDSGENAAVQMSAASTAADSQP